MLTYFSNLKLTKIYKQIDFPKLLVNVGMGANAEIIFQLFWPATENSNFFSEKKNRFKIKN